MYPKWIQDTFRRGGFNCTKCRANQMTENICMLGIVAPQPWSNRPLGIIRTVCSLCGNRTDHSFDTTLTDIVCALEAKFAEFESAPLEPPPIVFPKTETGGADLTATASSDESAKPVRPSRRKSQPLKLPTDEEVRRFLKNLGRTSFRTDSKSYRKLTGPPPRKPLDEKDLRGPGEDD